MNELIYASLKSGDVRALTLFPLPLLTAKEKAAVRWIFKYVAEFGKAPSLERFEAKFKHLLLIETEDPIQDIYQQTLDARVRQRVLFELDVARAELQAGPLESASILNALRYLALTYGYENYETFDREKYDRHSTNILTGFKFIDKAIGFLGAGEVMLLIGRLGLGKTTLMCWMIHNWIKAGANVLVASAEMLTADLFAKVDSIFAGINPRDLRINPSMHISKIDAAVSTLYADGTAGMLTIPNSQISDINLIGAMASNMSVDVIALDGVYLMSEGGKYSANWERVTAVSRSIKALASELKVPILETSQAKRGSSKELDDESASYADALSQDADFVLGIQPRTKFSNEMELKLIKNRFGPKAETLIGFDWDKGIVNDLSAALIPKIRREESDQLW